MKVHEIKIKDQYFDRVVSGEKTCEVRLNDRGYQKGDVIVFMTEDGLCRRQYASGDVCMAHITYVHSGYGMQENFVALSFKMEGP